MNPDPGFATKEIFFTRKGDTLYCICPVFPDEALTVKDLRLPADAKVSFLGGAGEVPWRQAGGDIEITMPKTNPSRMPCRFAWTFKIRGAF